MAGRRGVQLKTAEQILLMREAGLVVARTLAVLREAVRPGVSTQELDSLAEHTIREQGAVPSFLGYQGFPASICASVNNRVVHGIPSGAEVLAEGDIISLDCGAILRGWHGDAAVTVPVGVVAPEYLSLISACEDAMWAGVAAMRPGGRLTDIGAAVEAAARPQGYGLVEDYGGHGIGTQMHQPPHVLNYGRPGRGLRLTPGLVLAIEPMITMGSGETDVLGDDWTVVTRDGSLAAHSEHTIALTERGPWVLTEPDGGAARLKAWGIEDVAPA